MNYTPELLIAANQADTCRAYYVLCDAYRFSPGSFNKKIPYKETLAAAAGKIVLSKLSGPGTVFQVGDLPLGIKLNFIIQSGGTVETDLSVFSAQHEYRGTFAILCNEATQHAGLPIPNPAYPRPVCSSANEMVTVFVCLRDFSIRLASALQ
jgi:hypothetical protein